MGKPVDIQDLFKNKGDELFKTLYRDHRMAFVRWSRKSFACDEGDALEVFQDAMVILHRKIKTGQLTVIKSSLKTYLFAIGRNLLMKKFEEKKRLKLGDEDWPEVVVDAVSRQEDLQHRQQLISRAFDELGDQCRKLLTLFFYRGFAVESVMTEMDYATEDVVRTKKYKCLQQLRNIVRSKT